MSQHTYRFRLNMTLRKDLTGPQILEEIGAPILDDLSPSLKKTLMALQDPETRDFDEGNGALSCDPQTGELSLDVYGTPPPL